jgi:hypothetical protein
MSRADGPISPLRSQGRVIVGYRLDRTFYQDPTYAYRATGDGDTAELHSVFEGDLIFVIKKINEISSDNERANGQAYPVTIARAALNGVPMNEDIQCIGVSPGYYSPQNRASGVAVFDCQIRGTLNVRNTSGETLQHGDQLVWDIPDFAALEQKINSQSILSANMYQSTPAERQGRRTLIIRKMESTLKSILAPQNIKNPNNIRHNYLRNVVIRLDLPNICRQLEEDLTLTAVSRTALEERRARAMATLMTAIRSTELGFVISNSRDGEWVDIMIQL